MRLYVKLEGESQLGSRRTEGNTHRDPWVSASLPASWASSLVFSRTHWHPHHLIAIHAQRTRHLYFSYWGLHRWYQGRVDLVGVVCLCREGHAHASRRMNQNPSHQIRRRKTRQIVSVCGICSILRAACVSARPRRVLAAYFWTTSCRGARCPRRPRSTRLSGECATRRAG